MHHAHPAQPGRGHEATHVGGRPSPDRDDRVGAGEAGAAQPLPGVHRDRGRLGRLPGRQGQPQHLEVGPVIAQPCEHPVREPAHLCVVAQRHPSGRGSQHRRQLADQVTTHHDVVRRGPGDRDPGHDAASSTTRWTSSTTASTVLPSVSTTWAATEA